MYQYELYHKRSLPHIQPQGRVLFVTIRSADPIPDKFMTEYNQYVKTLKATEEKALDDKELKITNNKKAFAYMDEIYNRYQGEIDFTKPETVAELISDTIRSLEDLCTVFAYTIMPNHVHLLIRPEEKLGVVIGMAEIMQRLKGLSARQVNLLLERSGSLWYREYYDHWVRSGREFLNIVEYIRQNPVKAGLVKKAEDWKWTWVDLERGVKC